MSLRVVVDPGIIREYPTLAVGIGVPEMTTVNGPATSYGHNIPAAGYFVVRDCSGVLTFFDGPLTLAQVQAIPACTVDANAATLRSRATTALANNATYLAIASPTQAQAIAQVGALTRQTDGVIRLLLNALDSITDS